MMKVYLVAYHSEPSGVCRGAGRYLEVERAIQANEWPYDNGDDPSFFASRRDGGSLTWGVCRPDVRRAVEPGTVCVFFAYTRVSDEVRYRLSAVATVAQRLDRRNVLQDAAFSSRGYINLLIKRQGNGWVYDESDRPKANRHEDWLWRISASRTRRKSQFEAQHKLVYEAERFNDGNLEVGENYVVFSDRAELTYIAPAPPHVATARRGDKHETWCSEALRELTVGKAAEFNHQRRDYLRTGASGYPHRHLVFSLPTGEAAEWRRSLITTLSAHE